MKILVIRFSSIGDIVLTTPVVRCLKKQVAGATVHYVTKKSYRSVLEHNPYIDKLFFLEDDLNALIDNLKAEKYDLIIDLHNNLRTRILKFKLGVKAYSFDKLNIEKWLLTNFRIDRLPRVHIVDRYLKTTTALGVTDDGLGLDYFLSPKDEVSLSTLPPTHQSGYVAYAIGAQHATKKLPVPRMIELCRRIGKPIVLLGGPEDQANGETVRKALAEEGITTVVNACGQYSLNGSASLVRQADVVFSHDTGLMHIAAAFKKRIVAIWGNTIPAFGMYPYRTSFTSLENTMLSCRPCSKIGYDKCPKGHFDCMNKVSLDFVLPQ